MHEFALKADKVNAVSKNEEVPLGCCKAREDALGCENFDSGIVKTIEWYLKKYLKAEVK